MPSLGTKLKLYFRVYPKCGLTYWRSISRRDSLNWYVICFIAVWCISITYSSLLHLLLKGRVETPQGRLIVFPNSHVHKVTDMINNLPEAEDASINKQRIILVNSNKRIISTREVASQKEGPMSHEDALKLGLN